MPSVPALIWLVAALCGLAAPACGDPSARSVHSLSHEAYVWQRAWTGAVRTSVAAAPDELSGLRVLALEVETFPTASSSVAGHGLGDAPRVVWPEVDTAALVHSGRPVTAVVRIDGSRPLPTLSLAPLWNRLAGWRERGVDLVGVEFDHDCATAALSDYADWLRTNEPPLGLRLSITALPTWARSPALAEVAAAVDELVVQVHAIRSPSLFAPDQAWAWLTSFANAVDNRPLRVALPTYSARVSGVALTADPHEVAAFVRQLRREPVANVRGVVWFRLPIEGDGLTWSAATLRAVIADRALAPDVRVALVARWPWPWRRRARQSTTTIPSRGPGRSTLRPR